MQGSLSYSGTFYGDSIEVINQGSFQLTLLNHKEQYNITVPSVVLRGLVAGAPSFQLEGRSTIVCPQSGYQADIEFAASHPQEQHDLVNKVEGRMTKDGQEFGTIAGVWDGVVKASLANKGDVEVFNNNDAFRKCRLRRRVAPIDAQKGISTGATYFDSEITWAKLAKALKGGNYNGAESEYSAAVRACPQRAAPSFFSQEQIEEGPDIWVYKHASMEPWEQDKHCYVFEHDGIISTKDKEDIEATTKASGVPPLRNSVLSRASISSTDGDPVRSGRASVQDDSVFDVRPCFANRASFNGYFCKH